MLRAVGTHFYDSFAYRSLRIGVLFETVFCEETTGVNRMCEGLETSCCSHECACAVCVRSIYELGYKKCVNCRWNMSAEHASCNMSASEAEHVGESDFKGSELFRRTAFSFMAVCWSWSIEEAKSGHKLSLFTVAKGGTFRHFWILQNCFSHAITTAAIRSILHFLLC